MKGTLTTKTQTYGPAAEVGRYELRVAQAGDAIRVSLRELEVREPEGRTLLDALRGRADPRQRAPLGVRRGRRLDERCIHGRGGKRGQELNGEAVGARTSFFSRSSFR